MKRNLLIIALAMVMVVSLALTGCQKPCEHEWKDATCDQPKTCELCGATEGAPVGHTWKAATCVAAKTCETCEKVEGEALGHTWVDATCEKAKICSTCKTEEGEALGHTWVDATTEAPKTCSTCQKTEGEPIDVDDRFTTDNCKEVFGSWTGKYTTTAEEMGLTGIDAKMIYNSTLIFSNDGNCTVIDKLDLDACKDDYITITTAITYMTYESMGMNKAAADAAILAETGMSVTDYVTSMIEAMDAEDLTDETLFIYYVEDGAVYLGDDWDSEMLECKYSISGDKMSFELLGQTIELTKDAE